MMRKTFTLASLLFLFSLLLLPLTWGAEVPGNDGAPVAEAAAESVDPSDASEPASQNGEGDTTTAEAKKTAEETEEPPQGWFARLWWMADQKPALGRAAVFAIALLAAFLTVVEVWQIPPPNTQPGKLGARSGNPPGATAGEQSGAPGAEPVAPGKAAPATYGGKPLLFRGNFANTVLAGLAGLALVSTFDELWLDSRISEKPYYLVLFVMFFLTLLLGSAFLRGLTEAVRGHVSLLRFQPTVAASGARPKRGRGAWKVSFLVFADTFFNAIQGNNQSRTAAIEDDIAEFHRSLVRAIDEVRGRLDEAFLAALEKSREQRERQPGDAGPYRMLHRPSHPRHQEHDVRTNIALLSADEEYVFYVSRERGSLNRPFHRRSLAWLTAYTGLPFWWRKSFDQQEQHLILNNRLANGEKLYPLLPESVILRDYFEPRQEADYKAFVVLPLPCEYRGERNEYRRGAIVVSFPHEDDLDLVWMKDLDKPPVWGPGSDAQFLLHDGRMKDPDLAKSLELSAAVLTELLRVFNDTVFERYVAPRIEPQ